MNSFITEIYTPEISQDVKDEAACVVLSYCMAGMFLLKNQGMTLLPSHFFRLLDYMKQDKSSISFSSFEEASNTFDQISMHVPVSDEVKNYILTKLTDRRTPEFCMVRSIIDYLNNNKSFRQLVQQVTNNGIMNHIVIDVEDVSLDEPKSTTVLIDNEHINVFNTITPIYDFRTGIGGVGQKELQKDYGYEAQRQFILKTMGIDCGGPDHVLYYQTAHNNGNPTSESMELATRDLYNNVCRRINDSLAGNFNTMLEDFQYNFVRSIISSCYGVNTESYCTCLIMPSGKVNHKSFDVRRLVNSLYNSDLVAKCPENVNPSIRIMDGNNELFQLRFKKESYKGNITNHRYKMYFKPSSKIEQYFD